MDAIKWVSYKEAKWLQGYPSTPELRVVTVRDTSPLDVYKSGLYNVSLFHKYDKLAFVNMMPQQVAAQIKGNIHTKDKIAVAGVINAQVSIKDVAGSIKRMAVNYKQEESALINNILTAVREAILKCNWKEIISLGNDFLEVVEYLLSEILTKTDSCFRLIALNIEELKPARKEIVDRFVEEEDAMLDRVNKEAGLVYKLEMQQIEDTYGREKKSAEFAQKMKEERGENELTLEKALAELEIIKEKSKLLTDESGKMAAFPQEMFVLLGQVEKLKLAQSGEKEKILQEIVKFLTAKDVNYLSGAMGVISPILEKYYHIDLSNLKEAISFNGGKEKAIEQIEGQKEDKDKPEDENKDAQDKSSQQKEGKETGQPKYQKKGE